jgi:hypothetical protein
MSAFTIEFKRPIYRFKTGLYSDEPLTSNELQMLKEADYKELSSLSKAIRELGDIAWGSPWSLKYQNTSLDMRLEDLSTVWDDIPEFLSLIADKRDCLIHFFEQGDEFFLHVSSINDELVKLDIESDKDHSIQSLFTIRREEFLKEWQMFLIEIIKLLIRLNLINSDDSSLVEYKSKIENL